MRTWGCRAWLVALAVLSACSSGGKTITVVVVSDLVAGPEVSHSEVTLLDSAPSVTTMREGTVEHPLRFGDALARGIAVAKFEHVSKGEHALNVLLRRPNGAVAGQRPVLFNVTADGTVTVHITADCADVMCPGAGGPALTACLHGQCADPRCSSETPEFCPANTYCHDDTECTNGAAACATNKCTSGFCISTPIDGQCSADEYCSRERGCVSIDGSTDPGHIDPRCGRVCPLQDDACHYGYYACENVGNETTSIACVPFVLRPECMQSEMDAGIDAPTEPMDAARDARPDAPRDAARDATRDALPDAPRDGTLHDATFDAPLTNNPCDGNPCGAGTCNVITSFTYTCTCNSGYMGSAPTNGECRDIDECELRTDTCSPEQLCDNEPGTYGCRNVTIIASQSDMNCGAFEHGMTSCWGGNFGPSGPTSATTGHLTDGEEIEQIVMGGNFQCARTELGEIKCWGFTGDGLLGTGDTLTRSRPEDAVAIDFGDGIIATDVASGYLHSCAVLSNNTLQCWGRNGYAQLGYGDTIDRLAPPATNFVNLGDGGVPQDVEAGDTYTCAILNSHRVKCWGANDYGQLGYGDTTPRNVPPNDMLEFGTSANPQALALSDQHACARFDDGTVRCWGNNNYGELGTGDRMQRYSSNVAPLDLDGKAAVDVVVASSSTCVLLEDATVRCFGSNNYGQFGIGTRGNREFADIDVDLYELASPVEQLTLSAHMCARMSNNKVTCWGSNERGETGLGTASILGNGTIPTNVGASGVTASRTAPGQSHTCALLTNGAIQCWGSNDYGQLGVGDIVTRARPETPFYVDGTHGAVALAASNHTCAALSDGTLWCWGANGSGQLGLGDTTNRPMRTQVDTHGLSVTDVVTTELSTCALFQDKTVRCWGYNYFGQLGYGDMTNRNAVPMTAIALGGDAVALDGSNENTCALLDGGTIKCWGVNYEGRLGYGDTTQRFAPDAMPINLGGTATAISVGGGHVCALLDDAHLKCWGNNSHGQLGYGDTTSRTTPATAAPLLPLGKNVVSVQARRNHTCALLSDGNVSCWGHNFQDVFGIPVENVYISYWPSAPIDFGAGTTATTIDVGYMSGCAIASDATTRCWGYNAFSQLGQDYGLYWTPTALTINFRGD